MYSLTRQFCSYEDDTKELALGAILLNKLRPHVRSKVYDKTGNSHNLTPTELLRVLTEVVHKEATLQEIEFHCKRTQRLREDGYVSLQKSPKKKLQETSRHSDRTLWTQKVRSPPMVNSKPRSCVFCESKQYTVFSCTQYPTPKIRVQITRDKKICFNCFSSRHRTKECTSKRYCQTCSKRHHTSFVMFPNTKKRS
ncbi:hypothetical protein NECAME_13519 [Necator americanus]|uniref:Zinc knuckle n=1 Tax=Necator americanus TaxID=51031 RepID=W2SUR3_NECAM|nr:hypothetical protein NECAME_13519 [Necator americanus]ETN73484.1 hypothetical protein NECAME_13519 [Necator americanus]